MASEAQFLLWNGQGLAQILQPNRFLEKGPTSLGKGQSVGSHTSQSNVSFHLSLCSKLIDWVIWVTDN